MEVAGFAVGAVTAIGLLGQIFDGCVKAYSLFTKATNYGKDSDRLMCKIRIEEMRLMVWGREWGVVEGKLEAHIAATTSGGQAANESLRKLAEMILKQLLDTVTDFHKLQDKYGLREEAEDSSNSSSAMKGEGRKLSTGAPPPAPKQGRGLREELRLRAKWVVTDKDKFSILLADLKDFNDGLERLFPAARIATLQRAWTNELLSTAKRDISALHILEDASNGIYPQLNHSASLKQLRINLDAAQTKPFKPTSALKIPPSALDLVPSTSADSNRAIGSYVPKGSEIRQNVMLEYLSYDKDLDLDKRLHIYQRVDTLARMVHGASARHPDLHTLDCAGYVDDTRSSRYALVYLLPDNQERKTVPITLSTLLDNPHIRTPALDDRFRLAHTLAVSLWAFNSLDWLHKTFCSNNILFFNVDDVPRPPTPSSSSSALPTRPSHSRKSSSISAPNSPPPTLSKERPVTPKPISSQNPLSLTNPFLTGFDSSRPAAAHSHTAPSRNLHSSDLYRHPASLGVFRAEYCTRFDIYSLGLVLLEIGLWKPLRAFHKPRYSPAVFTERVVQGVLVPGLVAKAGRRYEEVVRICLGVDEKEDPGRVMEWVVGVLEGLRV
ncbi:MAG: hypothetical protein M1814_006314 [Vezdaea aestivalis]|nr:MAG: hypothetical protein M1814_006314 [Vezdaea aestivalis]